METIKKLFSELSESIEWIAENWQNGTWAKRLILIDALLAIFANETILKRFPFLSAIPEFKYYQETYYVLLAILFVLALAIEIYRKSTQRDILTFNPSERSAIKGLRAFGFQDAEIFKQLQRNAALQRCFEIVTDNTFRFGIIFGESGCGKTSFLQAGLCPAFAQSTTIQQGVAVPCCAVYVKFTDTAPEKAIYLALLEQIDIDNPASELNGLLPQLFSQSKTIILFIFDQYEQFFLHYPQKEQRLPFIQLLASWYQANLPIKIMALPDFVG